MVVVYKVIRSGRWVEVKGIPQKLGTRWVSSGGRFVHGPRVRRPKEFVRIYLVSPEWARERHVRMPGKPRGVVRVKVGTLKKTGKLATQSYLVPIRKSKLVRSKKGRRFARRAHKRRVRG